MSLEADIGAKIDEFLLGIDVSSKGKGQSDTIKILHHVKHELNRTQAITSLIRRQELKALLMKEMMEYDRELRMMGKCLCDPFFI